MKRIIFSMLFCFALVGFSYSQTKYSGISSVRGSVKDQNGALVSNATLSFEGTNVKKEITADSEGQYSIQLAKGKYKVTVSRSGFCDAKRTFDLDHYETVVLKFVVFPCVHQLIDVYDPETKQTSRRGILKRPFEEMDFEMCGKSQPLELTIRYGTLTKTLDFLDFLGFSSTILTTDGKSTFENKDLVPVSIYFRNEEVHADRVRFYPSENRLTLYGAKWVGNGGLVNFTELILNPCSE